VVSGMITTIIADYVRDETRGAANGLLGMMNGVGVLVTFTLILALPDRLAAGGMDEDLALKLTYFLVAGICFLSAAIMHRGLRPGLAPEASEHSIPIRTLLQTGLRAGKRPGLSFSYAAAFVARADLALVGAFLILWATQYGENELGLSTAEALKKGGLLIAAANGPAIFVAPLSGILADKIGRVDAVIVSMGITAVGYTAALLIDNPFAPMSYAIAVLIGVGQISAVITSQVLVQEQAPRSIRGSVLGMFGLFGGIGIMIALGLGGVLFDAWRPAGPFVLFGVIAFGVMLYGLFMRSKIPAGEVADDYATV
jgi:MFS family permease